MKQFKLVFPKAKAFEFASYAYTNEIRTLISWSEEKDNDYFGLTKKSEITVICVASDEVAAKVAGSEWKQFVQN